MMRQWMKAGAGLALVVSLAIGAAPAAWVTPQEAQPQKPTYSRQEYDAYNAAVNEKNLQQRLRLLEEFVTKYPNVSPELLLPAYRSYVLTYNELRNFPKVIEYADKMLSFSTHLDAAGKLEPLYLRTLAYNNLPYNEKDPAAREQAQKARDAALQGLQALSALQKPENVTDEQFAQNKKGPQTLFNYTAGVTAMRTKNPKAAVDSFKAAIVLDPNGGAVTYFQLGVANLQTEPPNYMDAFWALARSIALKGPGEAQVRNYLRNQMLRYQQPTCDKLLDAEMNELLTLAAGSPDRPASYKIYSSAELDAARQGMTVLSVINDLKADGDKARLIWLAACGLEFPDVPGKIIEVIESPVKELARVTTPETPSKDIARIVSPTTILLRLYLGATDEEIQAATTPNMEVKVVGQPEAARLQKDEGARFTGTLASYDPEPFMLHWDKAKVNAEDIPVEKPQPGKQPAKKAPTKRPPVKKPGR